MRSYALSQHKRDLASMLDLQFTFGIKKPIFDESVLVKRIDPTFMTNRQPHTRPKLSDVPVVDVVFLICSL
jgi:hypothetical protein